MSWQGRWDAGVLAYGAQTSGASTFSVQDFEPAHPLVSATAAQTLSEALRDRVQRQSTLRLVEDGELEFSARVVSWEVRPINVQGDETAGANRVSVQLVLNYVNERDPSLTMERSFTRYVDVPSDQDVFSQEDAIVEELGVALPGCVQRHVGKLVILDERGAISNLGQARTNRLRRVCVARVGRTVPLQRGSSALVGKGIAHGRGFEPQRRLAGGRGARPLSQGVVPGFDGAGPG